jgi:hypothetical protein
VRTFSAMRCSAPGVPGAAASRAISIQVMRAC